MPHCGITRPRLAVQTSATPTRRANRRPGPLFEVCPRLRPSLTHPHDSAVHAAVAAVRERGVVAGLTLGSTLGKKYESLVQGLQGAGETVSKVNDTLRAGSDKFESMCVILAPTCGPTEATASPHSLSATPTHSQPCESSEQLFIDRYAKVRHGDIVKR
jgi:hypothetical protein